MKANKSTLSYRIGFFFILSLGLVAIAWLLFLRNPKDEVNNSESTVTVHVSSTIVATLTPNETETLISPPLESFVGTYINSNPAPDRLDKIEIIPKVGNKFEAHMWAVTSSPVDYTGNPVEVIIDNGYVVRHITLALDGDNLHVTTINSYLGENIEKVVTEDDFTKLDTHNEKATSTPIPIKFPPFIPGITPSDVINNLVRSGMLCDTEKQGESNGEKYYYWKCEKQGESVQFFVTFYSRSLVTVDYIDVNVLQSDESSKNMVSSFLETVATIPFWESEQKQVQAKVWIKETLQTLTQAPEDFRLTNIDGVVFELIGGPILRIGEVP